jgi:hypothetical protein
MKRFALALCLLPLAACESQPDVVTGESGGRAEGEVLGGSISDDMIPLEQLRSEAPMAPSVVRSAAELDGEQPQASGQVVPAAGDEDSEPAPSPAPE